ncbi:MAG: Rossman fold protein, TIGR00730 family [Parcubacteria group bacterium 21-54-25]|nr:MAG: Rossman fold protein, TIGR00730 family [Parcubacteria group bacterium 21-54-25]HQU07791.1 TIGR00730 family Rossman fold protein [Candidatus Paceibacterota bacterium]
MDDQTVNQPSSNNNNNTTPSHETARRLARVIAEGHTNVPEDAAPLVCKPNHVESWRVFKIMSEFVEGFDLIRRHSLAATFFGSARATLDPAVYQAATDLAAALAKEGYAVVTGGSAGIMQAANKGAYDIGGASVGLNIRLPNAQKENSFLTEKLEFDHFFVRKVMLTFASEVYIFFPGGFGTMDEFFEIVTLVQTGKIKKVPIVMYDADYWNPLLEFIDAQLLKKFKTISPEDRALLHVVDSPDEALAYIKEHVSLVC